MTRQSRTWIALAEDQSLVPSTYVRWVTAACNTRSRGLDALFWPFLAPAEVHNPTPSQNIHANTYLEIKQIKKKDYMYQVLFINFTNDFDKICITSL